MSYNPDTEPVSESGWLCDCGAWNDHDFHCDACLREPPWGCDCGCRDLEDDEDEDGDGDGWGAP